VQRSKSTEAKQKQTYRVPLEAVPEHAGGIDRGLSVFAFFEVLGVLRVAAEVAVPAVAAAAASAVAARSVEVAPPARTGARARPRTTANERTKHNTGKSERQFREVVRGQSRPGATASVGRTTARTRALLVTAYTQPPHSPQQTEPFERVRTSTKPTNDKAPLHTAKTKRCGQRGAKAEAETASDVM
jgi:hypothetical protein